MSNRLVHLLLLAAGLYSTGAVIVLFSAGIAAPQPVAASTHAVVAATHSESRALPTPMVAHAQAPIPTLATITVHPARVAAADVKANRDPVLADASAANTLLSTVSLPGSSFDMPYYSFGKSLRRASKE